MAPKLVAIFRSQKCTHETGTHCGCPSRALQFGTKKRALAPGPDSHKFAGPRFLSCQHVHTTRLTSGAWRPEQALRGPTTEETPGGPRRPQGEVPENPEARYAPESPKEAPGRPKETQEAPGDPRKPPGNSRKPQKASRGHRKPQETPRIPKNSQEAPRNPRSPRGSRKPQETSRTIRKP
jgi:hypothetical protein